MIKSEWLRPGAIATVVILAAVYFGHNIMEADKKRAAKIEKNIPKQDQAQSDPIPSVDRSLAQPTNLVSSGKGVEYHAASPTPPTERETLPEAIPQPVVENLPPLVLCDISPTPRPTPVPVPKADPFEPWLPTGIYIPCILQGGLDSSHMDTPVQGIVTIDVYQHDYGVGQLIIPAGSRVSCFAARGYTRSSVEVKGTWRLLFVNDGTELEFEGIACDQQFDPVTNHYGRFDKKAGIQGELIEDDSYIRLKAAFGLLLQTAADSAQTFASSALQTSSRGGTSVSYNVPSVTPVAHEWIDQLINGHHTAINDTLYVRIKSGKPFWVFTTSTIFPTHASIGAKEQVEARERKQREETLGQPAGFDLRSVKKLLQVSNKQAGETTAQDSDENKEPDSAAHFGK